MSGICPRCSTRCYDAEGEKVLGKYYHTACFKCKTCGKGLTLPTYAVQADEIYCKSCHNSHFGPQGFRGGGGSSTIGVVTHSATEGQNATAAAPAAADPAKATPKFCSECGAKQSGGKFCQSCGHKF